MEKFSRMSGKSFLNASGLEAVAVLNEGIDPDLRRPTRSSKVSGMIFER